MECLLSYIIPAYNAASYIGRCLDSILSLPIENSLYEIIVIDDCSIDNTRDITRNYTDKHPFIYLLCQSENHKQGAARNRGLEVAKGKYVAFIDADDIVKKGIAVALERAQRENLDICFYGMQHEKTDGSYREVKYAMPSDIIVDGFQFLNTYLDMDVNGPTKGVFLRKVIVENNLSFVEDMRWEDGDFCLKLYSYAKSIGNIEEIGYVYKRNEKSTSLQPSASSLIDRLHLGVRTIEFVMAHNTNLNAGAEIIMTDVQYRYIHDVLRLRNLSKYTAKENRALSKALSKNECITLKPYATSSWEKFYLSHPMSAQFPLAVICPMAAAGRSIMSFIRKHK